MTDKDKLTTLLLAETLIDYSVAVKEEKRHEMKMLIRGTARRIIARSGTAAAETTLKGSASHPARGSRQADDIVEAAFDIVMDEAIAKS